MAIGIIPALKEFEEDLKAWKHKMDYSSTFDLPNVEPSEYYVVYEKVLGLLHEVTGLRMVKESK